MTDQAFPALIILAVLGSGAATGSLFAFSSFVMPGLARLPAPQGIAAMQAINITAIRPSFMLALFGSALLGIGLAGAGWWLGRQEAVWLLAAALLYLAGPVLVTVIGNVPLNDRLAAAQPSSEDGAALWQLYLRRWVQWNHLRSLLGFAAMACWMLALAAA
ncbi:anthrone oxygenase family protein [Ferrovibrio sp.]|uniref:anthrone oxygenase family protein n=1 Tax=Ferrovibrio sp. TaxID=1917215 RepID=UPI00311D3AE4